MRHRHEYTQHGCIIKIFVGLLRFKHKFIYGSITLETAGRNIFSTEIVVGRLNVLLRHYYLPRTPSNKTVKVMTSQIKRFS